MHQARQTAENVTEGLQVVEPRQHSLASLISVVVGSYVSQHKENRKVLLTKSVIIKVVKYYHLSHKSSKK